ncbi:hypothetical protein GCM10011610_31120 [Nocardia rhizosphaerihabitans]|uniref:Uncharacterized protein n=1 Tax=Nocardia rhizosphaerihabitans TaxID=1691570 RepID=A0ABQ2KEJ0_9NOCA|nr:hypothetical protein GCM10011610_31120 [Nocardia rhizosphaerihabitans]
MVVEAWTSAITRAVRNDRQYSAGRAAAHSVVRSISRVQQQRPRSRQPTPTTKDPPARAL